jgi:hypothetical protein
MTILTKLFKKFQQELTPPTPHYIPFPDFSTTLEQTKYTNSTPLNINILYNAGKTTKTKLLEIQSKHTSICSFAFQISAPDTTLRGNVVIEINNKIIISSHEETDATNNSLAAYGQHMFAVKKDDRINFMFFSTYTKKDYTICTSDRYYEITAIFYPFMFVPYYPNQ